MKNLKAKLGQLNFAHAISILHNSFNNLRELTLRPLINVNEIFTRQEKAIANSLCHRESNMHAERTNGRI